MTWEEWVEACVETGSPTDPLKWLESVVTQDVMKDPQAHAAMGRLYEGQRVPLKSLEIEGHSYNWLSLYNYLTREEAAEVGVQELHSGQVYCAVATRDDTFGEGYGDRIGLAMCLAAVEWHRKRTDASLEELLRQ